MYAAAFILIVLSLYLAPYAFCKVAADADAQADRYHRRTLQARSNVIAICGVAPAGPARLEVLRGR